MPNRQYSREATPRTQRNQLQNEPYSSPGDYEIPKIVGNK